MSEQRAPGPRDPFGLVGVPWVHRPATLTGPQRALWRHAWAYAVTSALLCVLWQATDTAYFTPLLPVLAWGAGVGAHAWWVFATRPGRADGSFRARL